MVNKLIIFGCGDIAELAMFYFQNDSNFNVEAFTVDREYREAETFCGLPCVDFDRIEEKYSTSEYYLFVAVSYNGMNDLRATKVLEAKNRGYRVANYVSSKATVFPDLSSNENCFILEDNTVQPFVKIGNNVTLWSGNHIGHHSIIEDNVFITSHVVVSGGVNVGRNSFIGVNATLHDHIKIAPYSLIAAGALVSKSTEEYGVYIGSPSKKAKTPSFKIDI